MGAKADFVVGDITIQSEGGEPYYLEVPFSDASNNFKGKLIGKTVEDDGKKHIGKMTLQLSRIDNSQPAQFTEFDKNSLESTFKTMTKQMAGQEMLIEDNTDIIEIDNVALCKSIFTKYNEIEKVTLNYDGDCAIPRSMFNQINMYTEPFHNVKFYDLTCNIGGNITIGEHVFPGGWYVGNLIIYCNNENVAKKWNDYKAVNSESNYNYKVYLNGVEYNETSAVGEVTAEGAKLAGKCYNAAGQQVSADSKGLTIQAGKKVIK
jgi:hypothetical protein